VLLAIQRRYVASGFIDRWCSEEDREATQNGNAPVKAAWCNCATAGMGTEKFEPSVATPRSHSSSMMLSHDHYRASMPSYAAVLA